jgi:hypothetical protein
VSQLQQESAQHLSFFFVPLVDNQLLFALPYFAQLKFLLVTALINIFLITFWCHKTCYKSFAIPLAYTGYDGCPSHHRFLQAKLIFPLDIPKKHQPFYSSRSPWISHTSLTPFGLFLQMFLLLHFLLAQKLLEGFCRDSSIRALPISSWPLNNSLLSFLEHLSLFSTHN